MARMIEVLDPTAQAEVKEARLAPRVTDLNGKVIAFLDNGKPNADLFLARVEELLREQFRFAEVIHAKKPGVGAASALPKDRLEEVAAKSDLLVNAMGD